MNALRKLKRETSILMERIRILNRKKFKSDQKDFEFLSVFVLLTFCIILMIAIDRFKFINLNPKIWRKTTKIRTHRSLNKPKTPINKANFPAKHKF